MDFRSAAVEWLEVLSAVDADTSGPDLAIASPIDATTLEPPRCINANRAPCDDSRTWALTSQRERRDMLHQFGVCLSEHAGDLGVALCLESGFPMPQCQRIILRSGDHFRSVSAMLNWPADSANSRWQPVGRVKIQRGCLVDDLTDIACALYCGCTISWTPPHSARYVARLFMHLWHKLFRRSTIAKSILALDETGNSPDTSKPRSLVWVAPSAPIERAVDSIVRGICWQNGLGSRSVRQVMVDHSLHWEIEHRLTDAIDKLIRTDPRDETCQVAKLLPRPALQSLDRDAAHATTHADRAIPLQAISTLPDAVSERTGDQLSLFSIDYREIRYLQQSLAHTLSGLYINTVPAEQLTMQSNAWHPYLRPLPVSTDAEAPW